MASCPSCNADYVAGERWCSICHTNVVNPEIGRLSSPGRRLGAYCLDSFIPMVIVTFFLFGAIVGYLEIVLLLGIILGAVNVILFTKGTTIGKKLLGMRVVKENGEQAGFWTMLIREYIGKIISALILWLGFLWVLFDKENQGWHDKLMSTYVVSEPKADPRWSAAEQTAEAAHQTTANAPQPTHLAQPMSPPPHQATANAPQSAPFRCLLEGQDSTDRPFALTISALALGDQAGVTLGRSPANAEFVIDHQEVSREHVRLTCADDALYAEDLNTLNGTKVNGRLLNPRDQVLLRDNDRLEIGPVVFTVRLV